MSVNKTCFTCKHFIYKLWFQKTWWGANSQGYCERTELPMNLEAGCGVHEHGKNEIYTKEESCQ